MYHQRPLSQRVGIGIGLGTGIGIGIGIGISVGIGIGVGANHGLPPSSSDQTGEGGGW